MTLIKQKRGILIFGLSLIAFGFGILTIKEGGTVLFGDDAARAAAGNYVPFVVWFNFIAGFAYVIASIGLWLQQRWAIWLSAAIVVATALAFVIFGLHIYFGYAYELRTVFAMSLRTLVWLLITVLATQSFRRRGLYV